MTFLYVSFLFPFILLHTIILYSKLIFPDQPSNLQKLFINFIISNADSDEFRSFPLFSFLYFYTSLWNFLENYFVDIILCYGLKEEKFPLDKRITMILFSIIFCSFVLLFILSERKKNCISKFIVIFLIRKLMCIYFSNFQ